MKRIKVGIIGIGYIGEAHLEAIRRLGYADINAVVIRDEKRAREICERFNIPKYFTDYKEILADSNIEVIHNCTPNNLHFQINKDIILSRKHILSEKPLTQNSTESQELVELIQKYRVFHAVNFLYRHYTMIQYIKELIERGELGKIYTINGAFLQDWLLYDTDYNWRVEAHLGGQSRVIADIGSHWFDIARFLLGQNIIEVFADLTTFVPVRSKVVTENPLAYQPINIDTEDYGSVLFRCENGIRGNFIASQVSAGRKLGLSVQINGSKASVYWEHENASSLWIGHRDGPNEMLISPPEIIKEQGRVSSYYQRNKNERWPDAQKNMLDSFYRAILYQDKINYATFEDAHEIMKVIKAVLESNKSGTWQKVQ